MRNIFCCRSDLDSEADVESLFVNRLLAKLRYPDNRVLRKDSLDKIKVGRGRKKQLYRPDYVLLDRKRRPVIVIDAKSPIEKVAEYHYQVSGYALGLNQRHDGFNPVKYTVLTNGLVLLLYPWDSDTPLVRLNFKDFEEDNPKFVELRSLLSYGAIDIVQATEDVFEFVRPNLNELSKVFIDCHYLIWKKENMGPTEAFYEFAKLMFVKLREDHRITKMVEGGQRPKASDFNFSVAWIEEQVEKGVDDNPMANILFHNIQDKLEQKIRSGEKKRIFLTDETLKPRLSTVVEVVRMLEHFNLHGIDEDLNGRMFETFLNATVRGKELGQFFTPRSVVKYMTRAAKLSAGKDHLPYILDGCCGSGGFLIEAMAVIVHQIDGMTNLSEKERGRLKSALYKDHLFGIDGSETIARIARLNMYLHGDGGSKIFTTNTLDKDLRLDKGLGTERLSDIEELQGHLILEGLRFDAILTNPPFSMSYKKKDASEKRILEQYKIALTEDGKLSGSIQSNVLFLERYFDLLAEGGELLTVIDNTVLNGERSQQYRNFILDNFIIRQVVSLPFNTFFRAQANVQTSILYLKRKEEDEKQGHVFMAILNNIGHDDSQRYTPERDNTPELTEVYLKWAETGAIIEVFKENEGKDENLGCPFQTFVVPPEELNPTRLDAFYYAPDLRRTKENLRRRAEDGHIRLLTGADLEIIPTMSSKDKENARGKAFRYFEIGNVTQDGAITNYREDVFDALPSRARLRVRTNDVIFAKNNSSRGTAVIIPPEFDGQLVTTGFIGVRPSDFDEALLFWSIFESETFRKQIYYLAVTAVQPEVREEIFMKEFLLPIPTRKRERNRLIESARRVHQLHEESRQALMKASSVAERIFEGK
ncbi:MAG: N-6 DNA methylase [bacterium]|nr:N-6 DNA methylase [bacterium]